MTYPGLGDSQTSHHHRTNVIGPGTLERLLAASPYNVVRLILPADVLGKYGCRPGDERGQH